ncbi:hypothetical protein F5Y03DRAFT_374543 [Xylaria venustula]|nr:hypothetical protein F5Y03DRAFT_374543 [Xylaria venustula]
MAYIIPYQGGSLFSIWFLFGCRELVAACSKAGYCIRSRLSETGRWHCVFFCFALLYGLSAPATVIYS